MGESLRLINGRAFKSIEWSTSGTPIVRIQNLNDLDAPFNYYEGELPEKFALDDGDLLFAWSGTPGTSFGAHIWRGGRAWLNQHIFKVQFDEAQFDKRFLRFAINQNLAQYIRAAHGGAGLAHITKGRFEESELPVPLLQEQRRIVAEIEKQFTRLDAGRGCLERVRQNLKRYRASVLKAACEGRLVPTEAALAAKSGQRYEPAPELLARILTERRTNWTGRGKYKDPAPPDTSNLPPLPEGWAWASLDQLQLLMRNGISAKPDAESGLPILRISAVRSLALDLTEVRHLSGLTDYSEYVLAEGDVLFTRYNGNPDFVGVCAVVPRISGSVVYPDKLIRVRLMSRHVIPSFAAMMANVGASRSFLAKRVRTTAGQAGISGSDLRSIPVPLAPLAEQHRIVAEVERRLSVIDELEHLVATNLQRATRLRQSILQRAFSGEL